MLQHRDPLLYKLPPQNVEAEEALISAILIDSPSFYALLFTYSGNV
jgi:hypothetical protein